jgi:type II secretory pathway component PulM
MFKLTKKKRIIIWKSVFYDLYMFPVSQEQIDSLKQELETMRARCERVEREKSDILLRRIAAMDTAPSKTAASEVQ